MKLEQLFTANRLALLAKLDRRAVERKLAGVPLAKLEGKARHYSLADALPALCREPEDAAAEARMKALKEREQAAVTNSAELDALEREKKMCLLADALLYVSETRIAIRQEVESADFLTPTQKVKLLTNFTKIRIPPPEARSA